VPSDAYRVWSTGRQARIDELLAAHAAVEGIGPGRRWRTSQLNWALTLRVAGEFQGFARDLHTLAVDHFVASVAGSNTTLANVLRVRLTGNRQLDRGNAQPGSLGADFGLLGMKLWDLLEAADPWTVQRRVNLEKLNEARNAVAHANEAERAKIAQAGYPMQLPTIRRWRRTLDGLARTMDDVVSDYLDGLLGAGKPW